MCIADFRCYEILVKSEGGKTKIIKITISKIPNLCQQKYDPIMLIDLDNGSILLTSGTYDYFAWECSAQDFTSKVSIVVLPVTSIFFSATPSLKRFCLACFGTIHPFSRQ